MTNSHPAIEGREMTKVYKIELLVIDHEDLGEESIKDEVERSKYLCSSVQNMICVDVDWSDDHPLNKAVTSTKAYQDLFQHRLD
jgi:hypothetical protein